MRAALIVMATLVALWVELALIGLVVSSSPPNWWSLPTVIILALLSAGTVFTGSWKLAEGKL